MGRKISYHHVALVLALVGLTFSQALAQTNGSYLQPSFTLGEHISDVFSLADSIAGVGFDSVAQHTAGTATYVVTKLTADRADFTGPFEYDGDGAMGHSAVDLHNLEPIHGSEQEVSDPVASADEISVRRCPAKRLRRTVQHEQRVL